MQSTESETWFRTLLDSAPDAMLIVDETGAIATANDQAVRLFGYDREELLGLKIEMLLPEHIRARHIGHRASFASSPELRPMGAGFDLVARRKDGTKFPVEISLSPIDAESGRFVSSVIRDVTERKKMEQEIIAAGKPPNARIKQTAHSWLRLVMTCASLFKH